MTERIDKDTFEHLVKLAELELDPSEAEYLRGELNNQLGAIEQLQAIPLDDEVPPNLHGVSYTADERQALREDRWIPFEDTAEILAQVPELIDDQITVPEIPHKTLD